MKHLMLALLLTLSGCFANVDATPAPAVECAFPQGVCPAGNTYVEHVQFDDGAGCTVKSAACYPAGTPADRAPADCYTQVSAACEQ